MGWICCAGPVSWTRPVSCGIRRPGSRPGISAGGCRFPGSRHVRAQQARARQRQRLLRAALAVCLMRHRCGRIRRRCCALFTPFILMRGPGRRSILSRWTGPIAAAVRTRITIRWNRTVNEGAGLYRPRVPSRVPRSIPDEEFNEIFARLPSHRDRALVAFYVSSGARASELLSAAWRAPSIQALARQMPERCCSRSSSAQSRALRQHSMSPRSPRAVPRCA
jgi:hypothetical protein